MECGAVMTNSSDNAHRSGLTRHIPVLFSEVMDSLRAREGGHFLDCTFGGGGHSRGILDANPTSTVVACDRDLRSIRRGEGVVSSYSGRLSIRHSDFCSLESVTQGERFDGILADLGMSTDQLFEGRGFSFHDDSPLDMRMDESQGFSAADVVNLRSEKELTEIFHEGGLGRDARTVARAIVKARPFTTTGALSAVVTPLMQRARPEKGSHPATVVFQAIRVAVNDEIRNLDSLLDAAPRLAKPGARFSVIAFHSGEDTIVTRKMRSWAAKSDVPAWYPGQRSDVQTLGTLLTKKAITPQASEVSVNPASRSARLRVFEFHGQ